jgi:hypothetical protein
MTTYYARLDAANEAAHEEENAELGAPGPEDTREFGERLGAGFEMLHQADGELSAECDEEEMRRPESLMHRGEEGVFLHGRLVGGSGRIGRGHPMRNSSRGGQSQ